MSKKDLVAVFVENASLFDRELGRLSNGYNILNKIDADKWIVKFPNIRIASPEEVAVAYGVK